MTLPTYEHLGGAWYRAWFPSGAYLDVENTRERSWPGLGAGDPPGEVHRALYEDAASLIPPDSWVADVGCGAGYGSALLARKAKLVVGMDIDMAAIAFADQAYRHATEGRAKFLATGSPGTDADEDAVVCIEVIEHVEDHAHFAWALLQSLKPGGLLYLTTPEHDAKRVISQWHCREYTWDQLHDLLTEAGFVDIERHTVSAFRESIVLTARRAE